MIVMKFGGTSVQDADAMNAVVSIVKEYADQKILIVSSACSGITSELLAIASDSVHLNDADRMQRVDAIINRHLNICEHLGLDDLSIAHIHEIGKHLQSHCEGIALLGECTKRSKDAIASCGELFSTRILSSIIGAHCTVDWFDARRAMKTDSQHLHAQVNMKETAILSKQLLQPLFEQHDIVITQGFIGSNDEEHTTTLGRGGSDYSAAIFGAVLDAEKIIIWTDVSGIASADPRVIPDARFIECMSFDEARMLSFFGAKVLHPETILPAMQKDIPVQVKNTFKSADLGTTISQRGDESSHGIRSVIAKMPVSYIQIQAQQDVKTLSSDQLLNDVERLIGSKSLMSFSIDSMVGLICDASVETVQDIAHFFGDEIDSSIGEYALISAIGHNLRGNQSKDSVENFQRIVYDNDDAPIFIGTIHKNATFALVNSRNAKAILQEIHASIS